MRLCFLVLTFGVFCTANMELLGSEKMKWVTITDFENPDTYKFWYGRQGDKGGEAKHELESKKARQGKKAMRLNYSFPGGSTKGIFSRLRLIKISSPGIELKGEPKSYKIWVNGDGSGNKVCYRISDSSGRTWVKTLCVLNFKGWKLIKGDFSPKGYNWGGKEGAPKDNFVFPLKFAEFAVYPKDKEKFASSILFDDFQILTRQTKKKNKTVNMPK